jgi:hypothetical protein
MRPNTLSTTDSVEPSRYKYLGAFGYKELCGCESDSTRTTSDQRYFSIQLAQDATGCTRRHPGRFDALVLERLMAALEMACHDAHRAPMHTRGSSVNSRLLRRGRL